MKLRGILGSVAVLLASAALAPPASAMGQVRIYQPYFSPDLYIENSLDVALGGISILTDGALGFTFNSPGIANLSPADSQYRADAIAGTSFAALSAVSYANGLSLVDPLAGPVRLGSFSLFSPFDRISLSPGETEIPGFGPAFGATLYDVNLNAIVASSISIDSSGGLVIVVPEPASLSLLGSLGAFALAYGALGGNRRRRSASVGAPT